MTTAAIVAVIFDALVEVLRLVVKKRLGRKEVR